MKKFVHMFILAVFMMGMFFSSPAVHAFDSANVDCLIMDCSQISVVDDAGETNGQPSNDSEQAGHQCAACGHGCHHSHLLGSAVNSSQAINVNKSKQFSTNSYLITSQLIYGLKRPPRTFA